MIKDFTFERLIVNAVNEHIKRIRTEGRDKWDRRKGRWEGGREGGREERKERKE